MSTARLPILFALLLAACSGQTSFSFPLGDSTGSSGSTATSGSGATSNPPSGPGAAPGGSSAAGGSTTGTVTTLPGAFRGDGSLLFAFGGWAWGNPPASAVVAAGFDWFETGYPGGMASVNATLAAGHVRPFAYINLGELDPSLAAQAHYTGAVLAHNAQWNTDLVDVTDPSWQAWIVARADAAWNEGSRGVKWDVATPNIPPGKTRADVNAAIASMMTAIRAAHPDMRFIYNQGMEFSLAYPALVDAEETEGVMSASSYAPAWCDPTKDPWYWGPQFAQLKLLQTLRIPVINAEYFDPASSQGQQVYDCTVAQGFIPYITNVDWTLRGRGYGIPAGW